MFVGGAGLRRIGLLCTQSLRDLLAFMPKEKGIRLVSLQYGVDDEELAKEHGKSIKLETIKDLDQVNDLEGVACTYKFLRPGYFG